MSRESLTAVTAPTIFIVATNPCPNCYTESPPATGAMCFGRIDRAETRSAIVLAFQKLNRHKTKIAQLLGLSERAIGRRINLLIILSISLLQLNLSTIDNIIHFTSDMHDLWMTSLQ